MALCVCVHFSSSNDCHLLLLLLRMLGTLAFVGSVLPHGLFAPSLLLGAALGRFVGLVTHTHLLIQCSTAGVYASIGAAAMLGGFMRLTIATTVTLVELTGDLSLVLPGMLSISIARAVSSYLQCVALRHPPTSLSACSSPHLSPFLLISPPTSRISPKSYDEATIAARGLAFLEDTMEEQLEHCHASIHASGKSLKLHGAEGEW